MKQPCALVAAGMARGRRHAPRHRLGDRRHGHAANIVAPIALHTAGVHPELLAIATGAGALIFSHVNDGGFWLVKEYFNMTVGETMKTWSVSETISLGNSAGIYRHCLALRITTIVVDNSRHRRMDGMTEHTLARDSSSRRNFLKSTCSSCVRTFRAFGSAQTFRHDLEEREIARLRRHLYKRRRRRRQRRRNLSLRDGHTHRRVIEPQVSRQNSQSNVDRNPSIEEISLRHQRSY